MFLKIFALVKVVDEFDLKILANLVNILEVTIASEVLPWVFETKTKYNHLLIPLGQVV